MNKKKIAITIVSILLMVIVSCSDINPFFAGGVVPGGNWIYFVDPSGTFATKRKIRIGRQNTNFYEVMEGLEPGEQVIISSYDSFGSKEKLVFK